MAFHLVLRPVTCIVVMAAVTSVECLGPSVHPLVRREFSATKSRGTILPIEMQSNGEMHQETHKHLRDPLHGEHPVSVGPLSELQLDEGMMEALIQTDATLSDVRQGARANRTQSSLNLRTRKVDLTLAAEMVNPWAGAVECHQSNANDCTCGNWGRWQPNGFTPASCVKNTLAAVYSLAKYVDSLGYKLHTSGGTLLGAMRCGTFIPWDYDADLGVLTQSAEEAKALAVKVNTWAGGSEKPASIFVTLFGEGGGQKTSDWRATDPQATTTGNVHIDITFDAHVGDFTLIPCVLNDIVVHCPSNYNEQLTKKYGADWKSTPKRWKSWSEHKLGSAVKLDEAKLDACETRMSSINKAVAMMELS